jgi:hypothetical protein
MTQAIRSRTTGASNIRILGSAEELQSLINTLVSEVQEDFVERIKPGAETYFFQRDQGETLFYKEQIRLKIREEFSEQLRSLPLGASERENGTWHISSPRFLKKEGQRIWWTTGVAVEADAYRNVSSISSEPIITTAGLTFISSSSSYVPGDTILSGSPHVLLPSYHTIAPSPYLTEPIVIRANADIFGGGSRRVRVTSGESKFEVTWSVLVTTKGQFRNPKIESIEYLDTEWE